MKATKILLSLAVIGTLTLGMADDTASTDTTVTTDTTTTTTSTTTTAPTTVDEQIAAIESATTPEERVALVNEFKETLATMNADERAAAIAQLQSAMQSAQTQSGEMMQTQAQMRQQMRTRAEQNMQEMQAQATQQMSQMQNMQQMRIGEQMANMPTNPPVNVTPMGGGQMPTSLPTGAPAGQNMNFTMPMQ